jgi:uncharacterized protein YdeI (YjbR/CyaY-like superfamily)
MQAEAARLWKSLSMWINEAKKDETRQNRIVKTIEMLKKNRKAD